MIPFAPRTFAQKLQWSIGLVSCAVLAVSAWVNYTSSRDAIEAQTDSEALKQVTATAAELDQLVLRVGVLPTTIAARQSVLGPRPDPGIIPYLGAVLAAVPEKEVYGIYIAFEGMNWKEFQSCSWVHRGGPPGGDIINYDYHEAKQEWYNGPKASRSLYVTEPYYDDGASNITMVSVTAPSIAPDGSYIGSAGADIALERLLAIVRDLHLRSSYVNSSGKSSEYTYLVSRAGKIITHPDERLMLSKTYAGENVANLEDGKLTVGQSHGTAKVKINGEMRRLYWAQAPFTGWKVVLNVASEEILHPVKALALRSALIAAAALIVLLVLVTVVARRMTAPVIALQHAAADMEGGKFDPASLALLIKRKDELGDLARTFDTMAHEIESRARRMEEWNQNLEQTVKDRTADLAFAVTAAEDARAAAEDANRTKSAFLANMSHELRTPMNAIIGYSEILVEEAEDLGQDSFIPDLKKIHSAGKHLLALINDVLDLSKIEAGKMTLYLESFDVKAMLGDVTATIQPLIEKNANVLVINAAADLGHMRADLTKVRQTLFNLLSNAAKFTEKGTITVDTHREIHEGIERMVFTIRDSGIGMTAEQLSRLFQAFSQADASTTRKYGGTGLGLVISKRFCRMMGGDIAVSSIYGSGTTFTFWLPVEVIPEAPEPLPTPPPVQTPALPDAPSNLPIVLVIDDDVAVRDVITHTLTREGYEVRLAVDGKSGLALAREIKPQAIVLDVMMPGMDGWAVLSALKSDPELQSIPVILATMIEDKEMGFALGAQEYLTKPVERDRLIAVLHRYLDPAVPSSILLVEDDPATSEMIQRTLEKASFAVRTAAHGRLALDRLAEQAPNIILLDLMMPEMDGIEFLREMRKHPEWRNIPVIILTAKDLTREDQRYLHGQVQSILQKGASTKEELLENIRATLRPH